MLQLCNVLKKKYSVTASLFFRQDSITPAQGYLCKVRVVISSCNYGISIVQHEEKKVLVPPVNETSQFNP